jgi:hypothetical protein
LIRLFSAPVPPPPELPQDCPNRIGPEVIASIHLHRSTVSAARSTSRVRWRCRQLEQDRVIYGAGRRCWSWNRDGHPQMIGSPPGELPAVEISGLDLRVGISEVKYPRSGSPVGISGDLPPDELRSVAISVITVISVTAGRDLWISRSGSLDLPVGISGSPGRDLPRVNYPRSGSPGRDLRDLRGRDFRSGSPGSPGSLDLRSGSPGRDLRGELPSAGTSRTTLGRDLGDLAPKMVVHGAATGIRR